LRVLVVMNKAMAKQIAQSNQITWGEVKAMMLKAYDLGMVDERQSVVNKSFSKATAFNIMWPWVKDKDDDEEVTHNWHAAMHCLREFSGHRGALWTGWRPPKKAAPPPVDVHHEPAKDPRDPSQWKGEPK
jgi:hypothetical protein